MSKGRILLVEDESLVAKDISQSLTRCGYEVVGCAHNVAQAIRMVADKKPDAAVMDVRLQGDDLDGVDAARCILTLFGTPVVFVSGYPQTEVIQRVAELGTLTYLLKPVGADELADALCSAIKGPFQAH